MKYSAIKPYLWVISALVVILLIAFVALRHQGTLPQENPNGVTFQEVRETIETLTIQPVLPNRYPKGTVLEDMMLTELYK